MRRALIAIVLAAGSGNAQTIVDGARINPATASFEAQPGEAVLQCSVQPLQPAFNFSFRFQTGYVVRVPARQYFGTGHSLSILMRITPQPDGKPVWVVDRIRLPEVPKTKAELDFGGIYLAGEGRYRVDWKMMDNRGRVCRKHWSFEAKRSRNERRVVAAMPPGSIAEISLRGAPRVTRSLADAPPFRLTVLLHVAPMSPRRTRLGVRDRVLLTGALSALLEQLPTSSVRIVAFTLDQQKELFREDNFGLSGLGRVARSINDIEMGTIDFQILQNRRGHTEMMAQLLNSEINDGNPSDVVLVLGPASRFYDKLPQGAVEKPAAGAPRFFFLRYGPIFRAQSAISDTIGLAMSKVRGKTFRIFNPGDFAKAIEEVREAGPDPSRTTSSSPSPKTP